VIASLPPAETVFCEIFELTVEIDVMKEIKLVETR